MRFWTLIVLTVALPLRAASPLGPQALLELARQHSETLGQAKLAQDYAGAKRAEALGNWLPQATLKVGESLVQGSQTQLQSPSTRLNVREDLLKGLDQPAALKASSILDEQAAAQGALAQDALARELGAAYFDSARLDEALASEEAVLKVAQEGVAELKRRVALGRNRRAELSSAQAQAARVQALIADLQSQRTQAREALASLCGLDREMVLAPVEGLPLSPTAINDSALESLPSLRGAKAALDLAEVGRLAQAGGFLPSLYAEGNWYLARQNGAVGPDWDAQLGLDLPIFRFGAQAARLKAASIQRDSARLGLDKARREALREARQARAGLEQALAKAEANRLSLEAAEKSYADQKRDFRDSLVTTLDLLNAMQAVEAARLDALNARYAAHQAQLRFRLASLLAPF